MQGPIDDRMSYSGGLFAQAINKPHAMTAADIRRINVLP
jgi:hypothetical protein